MCQIIIEIRHSYSKMNMSQAEFSQNYQQLLPHLPILHWNHSDSEENRGWFKRLKGDEKTKRSCNQQPNLFDIKFNNQLWQLFESNYSSTKIYLYAAYLDVRKRNPSGFDIAQFYYD